jgi:hypothetical protein
MSFCMNGCIPVWIKKYICIARRENIALESGRHSHGPTSFILLSLEPSAQFKPDSPLSYVVLRLLASDNKDQPPLPDHPENLLFWGNSDKMIPLGLAQYVPWMLIRNSQLIPSTLALYFARKTVQLVVYVTFSSCDMHHTLSHYFLLFVQ